MKKCTRFAYCEKDKLVVSQCYYCIHYFTDAEKQSCKAFPDGIPDEIMQNAFIHDQPYSGDNGILFKKNELFSQK